MQVVSLTRFYHAALAAAVALTVATNAAAEISKEVIDDIIRSYPELFRDTAPNSIETAPSNIKIDPKKAVTIDPSRIDLTIQ